LILEGNKVRLRPKRLSDALNDHLWRGDTELAKLDAAVPLGQSFDSYLLDYAEELRLPDYNNFRFAIETAEGRHIGNCSYYNLDPNRKEVEIGIVIGDRDYWSKGYGTDSVSTLLAHLFGEKGLGTVYLRSLDWNRRAHRCFEKAGFTQHDRSQSNGHCFFLFQCRRAEWEKLRKPEEPKS
jgi:RimJ/RimL family protein N-acetyltransferase